MMKKKENQREESIASAKRSRRDFMKKAVYSAPSILVLGSLLRPTEADAALPDSPPSNPSALFENKTLKTAKKYA